MPGLQGSPYHVSSRHLLPSSSSGSLLRQGELRHSTVHAHRLDRSNLYSVRHPLRERPLLYEPGLNKRSRMPPATWGKPHAVYGRPTFWTGPDEWISESSAVQRWRHGTVPAWWANRPISSHTSQPVQLTSEMQAQVSGVIGQLRLLLAKNLNRTVDTFRKFDTDQSNAIDKREFRAALLKLGVTAHKAALDATFEVFDTDRSGSIDFRELDVQVKRRTTDPSHLQNKLERASSAPAFRIRAS